ncbi:pleckstrin homology domain-containing family N member 1 isoform X2 [Microcaecilia unicolor]|uniref:Pleckstrin homology domain-containing family N member 1 isoform X2 n=1 Tax=Microcaecilia unicolor TaxID=1415580 RepID=A0A6P7WKS3_9AMPH|nr:pleckstrin homology domain-containing family N member 1 isoform X2 [Microcaecilia unicolor]
MGNLACVPQPRRGQRYSFNKKNAGQSAEQDSPKKWNLFGNEAERDRTMRSEKILHYIPAKDIMSQEVQKENLDQRFLSIFRKGRKKTVVRNLGQMIHYAKVKFKFQHCQEVTDCYLELFQSFLYFQSRSQNGLTYQGLLPLKELNVCKMENSSALEQEVFAFRITGPLLNPLIVYCPTQQELHKWLYHLEKQIQLNGGNVDIPLPLQSSSREKAELRWSVQNLPVQDWEGTQRESLGDVTCVSKVKLQHLPFQEQHERLLILYPSTLVILSEEKNSLYFKGELPLNAIRVAEEKETWKRSFLLEGTLINTIRVTCLSQEDYQEWIECLRITKLQNRDSSLSGSESFSGSRLAHNGQFPGSERSSLGSEGRTSSWTSAGKMSNSCRHPHSNGSMSDRQSFAFLPDRRLQEDPLSPGYTQPVQCFADSNWSNAVVASTDLKRGGSKRGSKGKCGLTIQIPQSQMISDLKRSSYSLIPEHPREDLISPVYNEPYSFQKSQPPAKQQHEKFHNLNRWSLAEGHRSAVSATSEKPLALAPPKSPLYADPYTPTVPEPAPPSFQQEAFCLRRDGPGPPKNLPGFGIDSTLGPPYNANLCLDSSEHDYAELQSFQSDFSYDNIWDNDLKGTELSYFSPTHHGRFYYQGGQENGAIHNKWL